MCSVVAFFPGRRRLTNGMLDDLRAAGFYAGKGSVLGWKPKKDFDAFAVETAAIRQMVALRFKRIPPELIERTRYFDDLNIVVWVVGHHKADPDAWLLLGKAAVDGLVDARVLRRDRDRVMLSGQVSRQVGQCCHWINKGNGLGDDGDVGFWVSVEGQCDCNAILHLGGGS